jgi:hypothetical protein
MYYRTYLVSGEYIILCNYRVFYSDAYFNRGHTPEVPPIIFNFWRAQRTKWLWCDGKTVAKIGEGRVLGFPTPQLIACSEAL